MPKRDIPAYIEILKAVNILIDKLISKIISLDKINESFDELQNSTSIRQIISFD